MITALRQQFLEVRFPYENALQRQRAQTLIYMLATLLVIWAASILAVTVPRLVPGEIPALIWVILIALPFMVFIAYRSIQRGRVDFGAGLFVGYLTIGTIIPAVTLTDLHIAFILLIPVVSAGVLFSRINLLIVLALALIALFARALLLSQVDQVIRYVPSLNGAVEIGTAAGLILLTAVFLLTFSGSADRLAATALDDIRHLQAFAVFRAGSETDTDLLAMAALGILRDQLDYNLAQLYIVDESGYVTRRLRPGGVIDRQFALRADEMPTIGETVRERRVRYFRRDASSIQEYPLAPARIGIIAPIMYQGILLGILDAQTRSAVEPTPAQISTFEVFAETLAGAFMNARRLTELQKTVEDQEGVIASFRTRLTELQSSSAQAVGGGWSRYLEGRGGRAIGFDIAMTEGSPIATPASDLPAAIRDTLARGDLYTEDYAESTIVHVPIVLRDDVLGAMTFTLPRGRGLTDRQIEAVRTVAARLGQSLENNRLFEQSQAQALRERKASDVSARLISATNVESLLELAAQSFNEAMGAVYTRVFIEPSAISDTPSSPQGSHANGNNGSTHDANGASERSE